MSRFIFALQFMVRANKINLVNKAREGYSRKMKFTMKVISLQKQLVTGVYKIQKYFHLDESLKKILC